MSDTNQDKTVRTPRLTIDQSAAPASEAADSKVEAPESHDAVADDFDEAMGLIKGTGAAIWSYAVRHPNTTLGAVAGFVLAVLVLTLGLYARHRILCTDRRRDRPDPRWRKRDRQLLRPSV